MKQASKQKVEPASSTDGHMVAGHETGRGFLTGPGLNEFPIEYTVVGDDAYYEGCIYVGPKAEVEAEAECIRAARLNRQTTESSGFDGIPSEFEERGVGLPTNSEFLWTSGVVPYTISADVPNPDRVDDAVQHIQEMTAIRLVRRTSVNAQRYPNYIEIISNGNKGWSSSAIGMRGGRQVIRFSNRHSWPILVHEFLHALGIYHEQSRSDRDDFVEIKWNNIQDDATGNFQTKPSAVDYFDYDYDSIMHYPGTSFAKDFSKPTIVPLQPNAEIGQRAGLSYGDRQTIAKMYERFFQRGYAGVWRSGTGRYAIWVNASWTSFREKWQAWNAQGLRLQSIYVKRSRGRTRYSGIFRPGSGDHGLWANVTWDSFKTKWQEWNSKGLRLVDFHVHRVGDQNRYSGVFLPGSGAYGLWANVSWSSFKAKRQEWSAKGLRLVKIHVHRVGNQTRYSGVFLPGRGGHGLWANASWPSFVAKWKEWSSQGLRLVDLNMHQVGGSTRYSGVFLPGNDGHYLWGNVTFESLRAKWQELSEKGLRLIDLEMPNPEVGAADFADVGLDGGDDTSSEIEPFGGIFGQESLHDLTDFSQVVLDGGGGLGNGAKAEPTVTQDDDANGGAFFESANNGTSADPEGLGGAFFDVDSPAVSMPEDEGYGGAVLPSELDA